MANEQAHRSWSPFDSPVGGYFTPQDTVGGDTGNRAAHFTAQDPLFGGSAAYPTAGGYDGGFGAMPPFQHPDSIGAPMDSCSLGGGVDGCCLPNGVQEDLEGLLGSEGPSFPQNNPPINLGHQAAASEGVNGAFSHLEL